METATQAEAAMEAEVAVETATQADAAIEAEVAVESPPTTTTPADFNPDEAATEAEAAVESPPLTTTPAALNPDADGLECIICFNPASKRALFVCMHARCCTTCAADLSRCPLCRVEGGVIGEIFI